MFRLIILFALILAPLTCYAESLSTKRIEFSTNISKLVLYLNGEGIGVAYDQVKRCGDCLGHLESVHRVGLAADLLFYIDGVWLDTKDPRTLETYSMAHDYWDSLRGSKRIKKDLNHFSFKHSGMR